MNCPFCQNEMQKGLLYGDGRTKLRWNQGDKTLGLIDSITGKGLVNAKYKLWTFYLDSFYCENCKKMIFDAEIEK